MIFGCLGSSRQFLSEGLVLYGFSLWVFRLWIWGFLFSELVGCYFHGQGFSCSWCSVVQGLGLGAVSFFGSYVFLSASFRMFLWSGLKACCSLGG